MRPIWKPGGGTHESGSTYGRYWHGYLVTLKPLLSAFTYGQIRTINAFWVAALALATALLMHARKLGRYILPFVITLLLIDPFAISMSLFYTSVYTVAMLTSIAFLLKRDWLCERKERLALLFVLAGCATSYLDLMTYPLLAYGILATLCLCSAEGGWKQGLKLVAVTLAAWFVGYAGMWAGKWIIGALFGGEDMGVLETIQLRASTSAAPGVDISFVRIVLRQLVRLRSPALVAGLLYVAIAGVCFLRRSPRQKLTGLAWTSYIAVCLLPLLWDAAIQNHSFIHPWFTYRILAICAFAGMCLFARFSAKTNDARALRA